MKNIFKLLVLTVFILTSCSDENTSDAFDEGLTQKNLTLEQQEDSQYILNSRQIELDCTGTCDNSGQNCSPIMSLNNPNVIECSCEGCKLIVVNNKSVIEFSENLEQDFFTKEFANYLTNEKKYNQSSVRLDKIIVDIYDHARAVSFYYFDNNDVLQSILITQKMDGKNNAYGAKTVYDCSGNCDDRNKTCRERYIASTGNVECTCQGTCKLEITNQQ